MAAKLIDKRLHNVPGKMRVAEWFFDVPVDYSKLPAEGNTLRLFVRSVSRLDTPVEQASKEESKSPIPWLVYLQGGPGFGCGPPQNYAWVDSVLNKGYHVLFLDQRGTGLSQTITAETLARQGNAIQQAEYLKNFRADNIVNDCEALRLDLTKDYPEDQRKWSIMGQSFGGFCATTYLSKYPESLKEAFICAGLPPMVNDPDPVYARTYEKVLERNIVYYDKYPEDAERVKTIMKYLAANKVALPSGWLTPARFQQLGIMFGFHGGIDSVHDIVLRTWHDLQIFDSLTQPTLAIIDGSGGMDKNVIYAILHEAIYCQGKSSRWSADRKISEDVRFQTSGSQPEIFFTGEMVFENMLDSYSELDQIREVAQILAEAEDWPALYNEEQLAKNEVPVYAATYIDDMYVHFDLASKTAAKIKGIKQFITNTMYHDALRSKSGEVMRQLFALRDDTID
ncbi:Proline iminopeptidase [Penicillium verhagenii]|uniref:Proline iminopeptidase n=1 Tax=Penicillium verhagenii TaxID=1562060 RepID=UPI00254593F9|nr:Proline iminopeptidase [Penicillium verhagenii]KAJ5927777.1 Proline iminopeptidase [Penicillium verhagenii]